MHGSNTGAAEHVLDDAVLLRVEPAPNELDALAGRVARWYAALAGSWIVLGDVWVASSRGESLADRAPDLAKGLVFVAVTTFLLVALIGRITRSHQRNFQQTVTRQRDFYRSVLATSSDVVAIFDPEGRLRYVNGAATTVLGWSELELRSRRTRDLVHPDDRGALVGFVRGVLGEGAARSPRVFAFRHADGSSRLMELSAAAVELGAGGRQVVVNARDVTDRVRSERQLRAALAEDVTGLPNLRAYTAEMALLEAVRSERARVTALLLDVDRFADVNALHGRAVGDRVLRELASRLEAALPQAFGVWHPGIDEFLAVFFERGEAGDRTASVEPTALVERVRSALAAPVVLDGGERVTVRVSIGVARRVLDGGLPPGQLADTLLHAAESALVEAKAHPDRVAIHSDGRGEGRDRARLVAELHDAVSDEQLVVHYQPKVRLHDGAVAGAEALVRWEHPTRGLLDPGQFLPAVAAANLSGPLTGHVLRRSLDQLARWLAAGCEPDFTVSVNVSLDDLRRTSFVDDIFRALERADVAPDRLTLEITEQTMLADPAGAKVAIDRLRNAGVRIAIDDFGTGFSALEHIRLFTVDELKLDKSFVQQLTRSAADEAIVDSVLAIGERLGVLVTAEGVEDPDALAHLRRHGCTQGQGYLFGRPEPAERFDPRRRHAVGPGA